MKKKKRGIRRASAVIAFILLTSIAFLSAVVTLEMIDSQIYRNSQEETEADYREQIGSYLAAEIFSEFVRGTNLYHRKRKSGKRHSGIHGNRGKL